MSDLKIVKPQTDAQKTTRTTLDTIEVTPDILKGWKAPKEFQRELKVNAKVIKLAESIKADDGIIPGVMTLGVLDKQRYLVDGQHRREAFLLSGCLVGYVDVRILHYETMAEMGQEFVELNSKLNNMKPDDILRGLEGVHVSLAKIRRRCSFVGYDQIRRGPKNPLLSMSALIRSWFASAPEVPSGAGMSAQDIVERLTDEEADGVIAFLEMAVSAWGRDVEYHRLWLNLNLTLCMWLYRRLVVTPWSPRTPKLTKEVFTKCLMMLSGDAHYLDWVVSRTLRERDRGPCYSRIKALFAKRLEVETGKKPNLPAPSWASR